jgi:hypothetical protein
MFYLFVKLYQTLANLTIESDLNDDQVSIPAEWEYICICM